MKMQMQAIEKNEPTVSINISLSRFWQVCTVLSLFFLNGCLTKEVIFKKAYQKFDLGYYQSAINDFNELIQSNSESEENEEAYLYRGISYYYLGNIDSAKIDLNNASISLKPYIYCKASNYLGWICLENEKDTTIAFSHFTNAKNFYENHISEDMVFIPQIYYALGKINYYFMKSAPFNSDDYYKYRDESMYNFKRSIEINKYYEWGFLGKGMIHYSYGNYDSAYADLNMAIVLYHKFSPAYYFRALCEKKLNNNQQAICDDYKKAIKYQEEEGEKIIDSAGLGGVCR